MVTMEAAAAGPAYDQNNRFPEGKMDREQQDDEKQKREDRDDKKDRSQ